MADQSYSPAVRKTKFNHCFDVMDTPDVSNLPDCYFNQKIGFFFDVYKEAYTKTQEYVYNQKKLALRKPLSTLKLIMKHAIPLVSCMGHPSDHPIFQLKVVWCPCQLKIEGCGDSYNHRLLHKNHMTTKEVYHH